MNRFVSIAATICACLVVAAVLATGHTESQGRLKVFILAGQSNMEGYGSELSLEHMADDPATAPDFRRLRSGNGYLERGDVWVRYGPRRGNLALGFGAFDNGGRFKGRLFGPEYGFGMVMGDLFDEQVLLIKCCWGGAALGRQPDGLGIRSNDFYPPSAGGDSEAGPRYRQMITNIRSTLRYLKHNFPEYDGSGYEIAGFLWFQGYNDQFGGRSEEYQTNLTHLIFDVRRDLDLPGLPVVIGGLGTGGPDAAPDSPEAMIRSAQAAVAENPVLCDTVAYVPTAHLMDMEAERLYRTRAWIAAPNRYYTIISDKPIHYFGSGKMTWQMGHAFGQAMKELLSR